MTKTSPFRTKFIFMLEELKRPKIGIGVMIKNKNNESVGRTNVLDVPFYKTDDTIDIWANTLGVVNDLTAFTQYSVESFDINEQIQNEPFAERFNNGLAGWVSTFTLTTHNDRPRCLYNLYPSGSAY